MHPVFIARVQSEAHLWSILNVLSHIALEDTRMNLNTVVLSTNTLSIAPVDNQSIVSSCADEKLF